MPAVDLWRLLLLLGLVLSLDSFRVSLCLGALNLHPLRQMQLVLAFGLCDGLLPLAGMLLGRSLLAFTGAWMECAGPLVLGIYGAWVIYVSPRYRMERSSADSGGWIVIGLPLSLSLDNLIAGASLGMIGFPLALSAAVIGTISALAALAGLRLGRTAVTVFGGRSELISGLTLVCIAFALAVEIFQG